MVVMLLLLLLPLKQNRISAYSTHIVAHFQDCFDISRRHSNWISVGVNTFYFKTVQLIQHFIHYVLKKIL